MSAKKIKKAVIPAAGLGTRFLPATKAVPKELLPIVDVPIIQYIMAEVVEAGIETVVLVTSKGKDAILDHFDIYPELQEKLEREGKLDLANRLKEAASMAKIVAVRQGKPQGLGHAVLQARELIGNEPFIVLLGDDLVDFSPSCSAQMIDIYNRYRKAVVALMEVSKDDISKFGICAGKELEERIINITSMVEKPKAEEAPSNLAIVGRYILTPEIFDILDSIPPGKGGEIQLTDAIDILREEKGVLGYRFLGNRYDAGDRFGFLQANIAYALKRPDIKDALLKYLKNLLANDQ